MTLRMRAITLIAVTVLGGVVLFALSAFAVVRSGYRDLGAAAARDRIDQVGSTIGDELVRLRRAAEPLASGVNAVAFARREPDGDLFNSRIGRSALQTYGIDGIVVLDALGDVVHAVGAVGAPPGLLDYARNAVLRVPDPATRTAEGVTIGDAGPALVVAHAITGPIPTQVPSGTLVFLRSLVDRGPGDVLGMDGTAFTPLVDGQAFVEAPLTPARRELDGEGAASASYVDRVGRTVLRLDADIPASIRSAEAGTLRQLVILSVALAAGIGITLLVWFERRLLSRLSRLTGLVTTSTSKDRPAVELAGDDELSTLAERIEQTLRSLEATEQELRSTNAQLEQAAEFKNEFISVVSHELRTPLTSILGFTETLRTRADELDPDRARHFLDRMSAQAHNLDRMVEELLLLSRMSSGRMRHEPEPVPVTAALQEVLLSLPPGAPVLLCPGGVEADVMVDPDHLRRIVTNYVENARKYGAPPIEVSTELRDPVVVVRVRDHGAGPPEEFVQELFEPFTQASGGTRRTSRGVGLGLSIVQALAEVNGGEAWFEGDGPGTTFAVSFPLATRATSADVPPSSTGAPTTRSPGGRVLRP